MRTSTRACILALRVLTALLLMSNTACRHPGGGGGLEITSLLSSDASGANSAAESPVEVDRAFETPAPALVERIVLHDESPHHQRPLEWEEHIRMATAVDVQSQLGEGTGAIRRLRVYLSGAKRPSGLGLEQTDQFSTRLESALDDGRSVVTQFESPASQTLVTLHLLRMSLLASALGLGGATMVVVMIFLASSTGGVGFAAVAAISAAGLVAMLAVLGLALPVSLLETPQYNASWQSHYQEALQRHAEDIKLALSATGRAALFEQKGARPPVTNPP